MGPKDMCRQSHHSLMQAQRQGQLVPACDHHLPAYPAGEHVQPLQAVSSEYVKPHCMLSNAEVPCLVTPSRMHAQCYDVSMPSDAKSAKSCSVSLLSDAK